MAVKCCMTAGAVAFAIYICVQLFVYFTHDPREPPIVANSLPLISPIMGMSRKKTRYYVELRDIYKLPIYTLRMPGSRLYVVNSPSLITAVQKQHKTLRLMPLAAKAAISISSFSSIGAEIIITDANDPEREVGYINTFHTAVYPSLSPGTDMDAMNRVMLKEVVTSLLQLRKGPVTSTKLSEWVKHQITQVTTRSAYGPSNPYDDPVVENAFWTFRSGMTNLILGFHRARAARDAAEAMNFGASVFEDYYRQEKHHKSSALTRVRYDHSISYGMPLNDIARSEFSNGIALLSNTVPTTFWMLFHIYSDATVLEECRDELSETVVIKKDNRVIDISKVKTSCPILLSTYKEVLRTYSTAVSARLVMEDHLLDNQHLLKKGGTVMMPSPVQHFDPSIWGTNTSEFDHKRFARPEKRTRQAAFRAFGGGTSLCPGRHFATTEILAFTAAMILQYDMKPKEGRWVKPSNEQVEFWESTRNPDEDVEVEISLREDTSPLSWAFTLSDLDKAIALSAEDLPSEEL